MTEAAAWLETALAAADAAGAVIRPYFRQPVTAEMKSDDSPVTKADREAELAIRAILSARFPAFGMLGEEFPAAEAAGRFTWVIDPIDGTRAFITGRPLFCTLIALLEDDVPILGIIDQPISGERWIGQRGEKTRFIAPGGKIAGQVGTRPCADLAAAECSCTSPDMFLADQKPRFERLKSSVRRTSWGGDAYAYGLLALGMIDVIAEATMKPWDWAALVPVIEGAGGAVTDWQGRALHLASAGDVLAVGNPALLPAILDVLR